jgi:hypothetical protein
MRCQQMNYRMSDQDCVFARNEAITGTVATQITWFFDHPVHLAGLRAFYEGLKRGRLGRVAASAILGPAGDRWSRRAAFAPLYVEPDTIRRDAFEHWLWDRSREPLDCYGGPAWRLSVTELDDGSGLVSMLVSHALADGYTLIAAIFEAATGIGPGPGYVSDAQGYPRRLGADAVAAVAGVGRAVRALVALVPTYLGVRKTLAPAGSPAPAHLMRHPEQGHELTMLALFVESEQWHAAAAARGGTHTTMAVAVMAELAQQLGRVRADGRVRIQMPAAVRNEHNDRHANSLIFVGFDVDARDGFAADLRPLRAAMKRAYNTDVPKAHTWDQLWQLAKAQPRPVLRWAARRFPGDLDPTITECSVVGKIPIETCRIDGTEALLFWATLCKDSESDPERIGNRGGLLRVSCGEMNGRISVRVTASHSAVPGARDEFRATVGKVLAGYGLIGHFF